MPRYSCPVTYVLQFALTFPEGPNNCIDVSMRVVSQSTNKMKDPRRMTPGISIRWAASIRIIRRNMSVKPDVTMPNGKSLRDVSCLVPSVVDVLLPTMESQLLIDPVRQ